MHKHQTLRGTTRNTKIRTFDVTETPHLMPTNQVLFLRYGTQLSALTQKRNNSKLVREDSCRHQGSGIPAHGIKAYGGGGRAEVQFHSFLALTLDGVEFKDRRWNIEYFEPSDGSDFTHQL
jgi:hypothetical protein